MDPGRKDPAFGVRSSYKLQSCSTPSSDAAQISCHEYPCGSEPPPNLY